jgi:outer membrane murein-binding lipoprotein Lpp
MPDKEDFSILPSELVRIPFELRRKVLHLSAEVVLLDSQVDELKSTVRCMELDLVEAKNQLSNTKKRPEVTE